MITLETGVPGAGKTLYCVDKLLRALVGAVVKHEGEDGQVVETKRVIYTNINGLLLDHEKIGPDELNTWHLWAKPGSIIVYDEIQKPWPLVATGSKVPECIQALETHRHMGVDFIVLTQHPMLIHANLCRLVGRHLHVRRMGNMGLAVVYEWDSCSKTLLYKNALAKAPYRYSKEVFKLYKSAELHTKQPRRVPTLIWAALFGLVGFIAISPTTFARITDRINPPPAVYKPPVKKVEQAPQAPPVIPVQPGYSVAVQTKTTEPAPAEIEAMGCARLRDVCRCYDKTGVFVDKGLKYCLALVEPAVSVLPSVVPFFADQSFAAPAEWSEADSENIKRLTEYRPG